MNMKKFLIISISMWVIILNIRIVKLYAQFQWIYPRIEEIDSDPNGIMVKIKFPDGSLTKSGTIWTVKFFDPNTTGWYYDPNSQILYPTDPNCDLRFSLNSLTAERLLALDPNKSVTTSDIVNWIAGTVNQLTVTDDGDGTTTLSLPQDIDPNADVEFDSVILGDLTVSKPVFTDPNGLLVSTGTLGTDQGGTGQTTYTDGQLLIGNSTGNTLTKNTLTGTANQIEITNGSGSITLNTPQDTDPNADVEFDSITLDDLTVSKPVFTDPNGLLVSEGTLGTDQGGTGQTTYTDGQLLIGNSTGNTLAKATLTGTTNQIEITNGSGSIILSTPQNTDPNADIEFDSIMVDDLTISKPVFTDPNGLLVSTGTVLTDQGGTGLATFSQGDTVYYNSGTSLEKLVKDIIATRYISNTGANNNPAWAQVNLENGVIGVLPIINGGSGTAFSDPNADRILFWDDSNSSVSWLVPNTDLAIDSNNLNVTSTIDSVTGRGSITINTVTFGDVTINGADPAIIFDSSTAGDTDYWAGVIADANGVNDDLFQIGYGATKGTNAFLSVDPNGRVGLADRTESNINFYVDADQSFEIPLYITMTGQIYDLTQESEQGQYLPKSTALVIRNTNLLNNVAQLIYFDCDNASNKNTGAFIGAVAGTSTNGPANIVFGQRGGATTWNERMRIATNGYVGIGTNSPENSLEIQGAQNLDAILCLDANQGLNNADTWKLRSDASDNSFYITNHVTDVLSLNSSGDLAINGDITVTGDNIIATTNTDRFVFMAGGSNYAPEAIDLGTDTTGNYTASVATNIPLYGGLTAAEGTTHTIWIDQNQIDHDILTNFSANEHQDTTAWGANLVPDGDGTWDLGAIGGTDYRWANLYLSGNLSDETNSLTIANVKTAYDHSQIAGGDSVHVSTTENTNWDTAHTHSQDNTQAHSDYFLNSGSDIAGAGSGFTWTFDASSGTDSVVTFGDGTINVSTGALQVGGVAVLTGSPFGSTIDDTELTPESFGDFNCTGAEDGCTLNANSVSDNEIDYTQVNMDDMTDGSTNAAITLTQEANFETAYTHSQDNTQAHSDYLLNSGDDSTSGRITSAGVTSNNADIILDSTGTDQNSPNISLRGDDGGVEEEATLHLIQGADPYLRISVDDDNTSPVLTGVIDIHDTVIGFVNDNTCDIGANGASRPKDIWTSGNYTGAGNVSGATYGSDSSITDAELLTLDNGATTEILVGGGAGSAPVWTTATGTGAPVRAGSPTFTTNVTVPLVIGGTETTSDLSLKTTSAVGATGADMHFLVGNNGATEAVTILNAGNVGIGETAPGAKLSVSGGVAVGSSYSTTAVSDGSVIMSGNLGINESSPETLIEVVSDSPYFTIHNSTHESTDGGMESRLRFKGEDPNGVEWHLGTVQASHDGTDADGKGDLIFYVNDGNDADDSLTEAMRIDSSSNVTLNGDITIGGGNINTGNIAITIGDAATDSITFQTDGTGEGEVELPDDSIGDEEIDWSDVTSTDMTFDADTVPTTAVYSGATSLEEATAADDSGGYIVGVFDEFTNSDSVTVQGVLNDLDAALDLRCLESIFGTAIGTGLTLDGTTLKTHVALQSISGLTETNGGIPYGTADNSYAWLDAGAEGTLLMGNGTGAPSFLGAGASGYILVAAGAADPVWTAPTGTGAPVKADSATLTTFFQIGSTGVKISDDSDGALTFLGLGDGYDEDLTLNFDDTENKIVFSSSTSAGLDFGSLAIDCDSLTITLSTVAGVIDMGSATSLEIPQDSTVDATGKITWDTTDGTLVAHDGTAARVIGDDIYQTTYTIYDDGDWTDDEVPIWISPKDYAITIVQVSHACMDANSLTYNIEERPWGSLNDPNSATDIWASDEIADQDGEDETSFSDASIAAKSHLLVVPSAESGSVSVLTGVIYYRKNVE